MAERSHRRRSNGASRRVSCSSPLTKRARRSIGRGGPAGKVTRGGGGRGGGGGFGRGGLFRRADQNSVNSGPAALGQGQGVAQFLLVVAIEQGSDEDDVGLHPRTRQWIEGG